MAGPLDDRDAPATSRRGEVSAPLVVLAGDAAYARPIAVAVHSLVRRTPEPFDLVVVDGGLDPDARALLARAADPRPVRFERLRPEWLASIPAGRLPAAAWSRLFVSRWAPDDCERILYLDGDVLVRRSIHELVTVDLCGATVGAVAEPGLPPVGTAAGTESLPGWRAAGMPPSFPIFNSGVLVIDRQAWDGTDVVGRMVDAVRMGGSSRGWNDQGYLNLVLWAEWRPLAARWNSRRADAWIAHFYGPFKPWTAPRMPTGLYVEYLEEASRVGWDIGGRHRLRLRREAHRLAGALLPGGVLARRQAAR